jgi:hypothetical protein
LVVNAIFFEIGKIWKSYLKSDEGIFLGYSTNSRAYRVYNTRIENVMESINVVIDDEIEASSKVEIP